jgi:hypothetical protein
MRVRCPVCGLPLERGEEGYQVGSYMLNIIASELVLLVLFLAVLVLTWPAPPWAWLQYGGAALAILAPFLFLPLHEDVLSRLRPGVSSADPRRASVAPGRLGWGILGTRWAGS